MCFQSKQIYLIFFSPKSDIKIRHNNIVIFGAKMQIFEKLAIFKNKIQILLCCQKYEKHEKYYFLHKIQISKKTGKKTHILGSFCVKFKWDIYGDFNKL